MVHSLKRIEMLIHTATALTSDGQLRRELAISGIPENNILSLNLLTKLGARHERACHFYTKFIQATKYEIWSEIASHNGPDSHGNSATELADGRFDTWTEKFGGGERGHE